MVVFVNILIQNPDKALHAYVEQNAGGGMFGSMMANFATAVVDEETLTETVALITKNRAKTDVETSSNLKVSTRIRESHPLYFVVEISVDHNNEAYAKWIPTCCGAEQSATYIAERRMASTFPRTLKEEFKQYKIEADIVCNLTDERTQDEYADKVLRALALEGEDDGPQNEDEGPWSSMFG